MKLLIISPDKRLEELLLIVRGKLLVVKSQGHTTASFRTYILSFSADIRFLSDAIAPSNRSTTDVLSELESWAFGSVNVLAARPNERKHHESSEDCGQGVFA